MFEFFTSKEKKSAMSHMRHLVRLAKSDGLLHRDELEFIRRVGEKSNLTEADIKRVIENPTSVDIEIPDNDADRFDQLFDLVALMMRDGQVNDAEFEFATELANRLGFRKVIVGILVAKIQRGIDGGLSKLEIKEETGSFLDFKK